MKLNNVKPAQGAVKSTKRIGRGQGSGHGGTSTRGHKGQKSRSGYKSKIGFEGGQMPLQRRVPKYGFTNMNRVEYKGVNLDTLAELVETKKLKEVTIADIKENGLAGKNDLVKILGRGEFTAKVKVAANAFTKTAQASIESAGGSVEVMAKK